jgi:hypothetical protein
LRARRALNHTPTNTRRPVISTAGRNLFIFTLSHTIYF